MTTFKALLVLSNTNPVCQSSLWELAGPCRDRVLQSRSSPVTQFSCLHQRITRNSPRQGWQRCHRRGMPSWSPAPPVPRVSPAPGASTLSPPSQTQRWAVHVTGGSHLSKQEAEKKLLKPKLLSHSSEIMELPKSHFKAEKKPLGKGLDPKPFPKGKDLKDHLVPPSSLSVITQGRHITTPENITFGLRKQSPPPAPHREKKQGHSSQLLLCQAAGSALWHTQLPPQGPLSHSSCITCGHPSSAPQSPRQSRASPGESPQTSHRAPPAPTPHPAPPGQPYLSPPRPALVRLGARGAVPVKYRAG